MSILLSIRSVLFRFGLWVLSLVLGERMRRIMFMSSFAKQLQNEQLVTDEDISNLNRALELASDDRTIALGVEISHMIWTAPSCQGVCVQVFAEPVDERSRLVKLFESFYDAVPKYLRYGCRETMAEDFMRLVAHSRAPRPN